VNGIGTWYYGKKNLQTHLGNCEFCKHSGELQSYDTTLYAVFVMIPLIPLGKKRILDQCPKCKKHRVMSLKEWEEKKKNSIKSAVESFRSNPKNPEKVKDLIATAYSFQDKETFLQLTNDIKINHRENAEVLALLGSAYAYFNLFKEAEESYRMSLNLNDDPKTREYLATALIDQSRPNEAQSYLKHILDRRLIEKIGLIFLLIEGYQVNGMHNAALEILNQCVGAFPDVLKNKQFKKYKKISEKNLGSTRKIKSQSFKTVSATPQETKGHPEFLNLIPKLIGPIVLVVLLLLYLFVAYSMGRSRSIYLVNGLKKSYEININGKIETLPAASHKEIKIPEGKIVVKVPDEKLQIPEQTCRIETPFFSRPFVKRIFVLNPDKVALLIQEQTQYAVHPEKYKDEQANLSYKYFVGNFFYQFKRIHYVFTDFPKEISLPSGSSKAKKERLALVNDLSTSDALSIILRDIGKEACLEFAKNNLSYNPKEEDEEVYLLILSGLMTPNEYITFLSPKLQERPVKILWHRMYQNVMEKAYPEKNLIKEYNEYLEKDKNNSALIYLLGRITDDPDEAEKLFLQSINVANPSPYGYNALAYDKLCNGQFEEGFPLVQKALELSPNNISFLMTNDSLLLALEKYDELLKINLKEQMKNPYDAELVASEIALRMQKGEKELAQKKVKEYCDKLKQEYAPDDIVKENQDYLNAIIYYNDRNIKEYIGLAKTLPNPINKFDVAFIEGRLEDAEKALGECKPPDIYNNLTLYLAAELQNKKDLADRQLKLGIVELQKGTKEERMIAECLTGKRVPDATKITRFSIDPTQKRTLMTVMGIKFPQQKDLYFAMAKKLNFSVSFPYYFLNEILSKQ